MKLVLVVSSIFICFEAQAGLFDKTIRNCFEAIEKKVQLCKSDAVCLKAASAAVNSCLRSHDIDARKCEVSHIAVRCSKTATEGLIAGTSGCKMEAWNDSGEVKFFLVSDSTSTSCHVQDFKVSDSVESILELVERSGSKWKIGRPVFSIGLLTAIRPSEIQINEVSDSKSKMAPWYYLMDGDFQNPGLVCERRSYDLLAGKFASRKPEVFKSLGFEIGDSTASLKHFKVTKNQEVVSLFETLKAVKLCGVQLPIGTELFYSQFGHATCMASTPGAVEIEGFPAHLFPNFKLREGSSVDEKIVCSPVVRRLSAADQMAAKNDKEIVVPILDWQQCDCRQRNPF